MASATAWGMADTAVMVATAAMVMVATVGMAGMAGMVGMVGMVGMATTVAMATTATAIMPRIRQLPTTTHSRRRLRIQPYAQSYADRGEAAFKTGNYTEAVYDWRHALVDDPQNGTLGMLYAQALFAYGTYDEAAGATQVAMSLLPIDQWGVVVKNYTDLYPNIGSYTNQLRRFGKRPGFQARRSGAAVLARFPLLLSRLSRAGKA